MKKAIILALAIAAGGMSVGYAQSFPNWNQNYIPSVKEWQDWWAKKLDVNGDASNVTIDGQSVSHLLSLKVDETNGVSTAQTLTSPTINNGNLSAPVISGGSADSFSITNGTLAGTQVNLFGTPAIMSCPVGSCPPATDSRLAYAAMQQYAVSQKADNWELGAVIGLLDNTGAGTGEANDQTPGAKMGAYVGLMQTPAGGPGWAFNTNIIRCAEPGSANSIGDYAGAGTACTTTQQGTMNKYTSTIGYELDVSNFDQDSNGLPPTYPFVVGQYITTTSFFSSYAGVFFGIGSSQSADAWHNGIMFSSPGSGGGRTVSDNTVSDLSNADIGYHSQGVHATAGWYDETTGKYGLWVTGTKSIEDIDLSTETPVGIGINGTRSGEGVHLNVTVASGSSNSGISDTGSHGDGQSYDDHSTSAVGIKAEGTYSYAAFSAQQATTKIALAAAQDQEICFDNSDRCLTYDGTKLVYSVGTTRLASIDDSGNMIIKGTLSQSGLP